MLKSFFLVNAPCHPRMTEVQENKRNVRLPLFEMGTCQRWLACGMCENVEAFKSHLQERGIHVEDDSSYEILQGNHAYRFLLEVVCGLKSKLIGENEIVKQFKDSYRDYLIGNNTSHSINLTPILEKILQDSKKLRTHFLTEVGQHSYASIAHKLLSKEKKLPLLILGSGKLAEELISYFIKKRLVYISARNKSEVEKLTNKYAPLQTIDWDNQTQWLRFKDILNTIGVLNFSLLDDRFFDLWERTQPDVRLIDFSNPSSISTRRHSPSYYSLQDIFAQGALSAEQKLSKVSSAKIEIEKLVSQRAAYFSHENKEETLNSLKSMIKTSYANY